MACGKNVCQVECHLKCLPMGFTNNPQKTIFPNSQICLQIKSQGQPQEIALSVEYQLAFNSPTLTHSCPLWLAAHLQAI
jgi:hypothetical protein